MIAGQIAADEVVGSNYAEDVTTLWGIRQKLCSMALTDSKRSKTIRPEACRKCGHCAYGKQLLKLIAEGKIKV